MTDPLPGPPAVDTVVTPYLTNRVSASDDEIQAAYAAELASQRSRCRVPADDQVWPADLVEALCRRVMHNLALRGLPLGLEASVTDAGAAHTRVGGLDAEVRRLEAPYRKVTVG